MSWTVRHQGSPRQIEDLTSAEVFVGLQDGQWEQTDEVRGPDDTVWTRIERHPQFAELVMSLEPPERREPIDETTLDFNPLIDVTMVLLVFCILTMSYATLEKVLDMPKTKADDPGAVKVVAQDRVENFMIVVKASQEAGKPVIWVEGEQVAEAQLKTVLLRLTRETKKSELLLDAAGVDYGTVIKIIDAAGGARIDQVHFLTRPG